MSYMIVNHKSRAAKLVTKPNWDGDWEQRYFPNADPEYITASRIDGVTDCTNMLYNEELSGPDGMHFTLFSVIGSHTANDTKYAKSWLRSKFDATGFDVVRVINVEVID